MSPFLREHAAPLVGSTLLHVLVAVAALVATWYAVVPKVSVPPAIEAYIAAAPAARPQPAPPAAPPPAAAEPEPTPTPTPAPAPVPAPVPEKREPDPALAAEARAQREAAAAARREEALRVEHEAEQRAAAARDKARAADARRRAEAETQRRVEAEAAKRRAQAEEAKRAAAAAAAAAQKRQADADAKLRAARESDLAKELAAEEQRTGAVNAGLESRYIAEIRAAVERAWNRPPTARTGLRCMVYVTQVFGGTVKDVKIGECNGDAAVQQSITTAVLNASPLPMPRDSSLFVPKLTLEFAPHD